MDGANDLHDYLHDSRDDLCQEVAVVAAHCFDECGETAPFQVGDRYDAGANIPADGSNSQEVN
jgi:hypothetical protein